jgi:hypothetical protein
MPVLQTLPHAPQFRGSVRRLAVQDVVEGEELMVDVDVRVVVSVNVVY